MIFTSILWRELSTKLKSPQFYLLAILSPILFLIPVIFSLIGTPRSNETREIHIGVLLSPSLQNQTPSQYGGITFVPIRMEGGNLKQYLSEYDYVLDISHYNNLESITGVIDIHLSGSENLSQHNHILGKVESWFNYQKSNALYSRLVDSYHIETYATGEIKLNPLYDNKKNSAVATTLAYTIGMLIYLTLILYNNNLSRSITEEMNSKLAEVLSIYVSTKSLVLGKIIGMSIASLLQVSIFIASYIGYFILLIWYDSHYIGHYNPNLSPIETLISLFQVNLADLISIEIPIFFFLGVILNGGIFSIIVILSKRSIGRILSPLGNMLTLLTIYFGMYVAGNPNTSMTKVLSYLPISSYITIPVLSVYGTTSKVVIGSLLILVFVVVITLLSAVHLYKKSLKS